MQGFIKPFKFANKSLINEELEYNNYLRLIAHKINAIIKAILNRYFEINSIMCNLIQIFAVQYVIVLKAYIRYSKINVD